jgi:hypothetical protein
LSKSQKYYYDFEAVKEPMALSSFDRLNQDVEGQQGSDRVPGKTKATKSAGKMYRLVKSKNVQIDGVKAQCFQRSRPLKWII